MDHFDSVTVMMLKGSWLPKSCIEHINKTLMSFMKSITNSGHLPTATHRGSYLPTTLKAIPTDQQCDGMTEIVIAEQLQSSRITHLFWAILRVSRASYLVLQLQLQAVFPFITKTGEEVKRSDYQLEDIPFVKGEKGH